MLQNPHSFLPIAFRAASRIISSPVLAEEASERAVHQLTLAMLQGCTPDRPEAWLRVVARRSACALLRSEWARTRGVDFAELANAQTPAPFAGHRRRRASWVRENLLTTLTPRQRDALDAAITCNTTRAAARTCGMQPRDFRRSLGSISRKAKLLLASDPAPSLDALAPGCEPGLSV
jgi:DNA-directed RNA polymerase specialized sigma24 family protein